MSAREPGRSDDESEAPAAPSGARVPLSRNVKAIGLVSFFTDFSSEMIYPLLPVFLSTTLGASAGLVGGIEGAAESTAALLKLASGWWSDRVHRRKPLVVAGYALASAVRPLVALATSPLQVLMIRLADRVGKGVRSSPRDALIAESVVPADRGRAFGFHRAADHAGAVAGPLVAFAMLRGGGVPLRTLFWWAAVPGAVSVAVVVLLVREIPRGGGPVAGAGARGARGAGGSDAGARDAGARDAGARDAGTRGVGAPPRHQHGAPILDRADRIVAAGIQRAPLGAVDAPAPALGGRFWAFLGVVLLFTLGNSTDAFLILRANQLGVPVALVPILWAMLHVVKSASSTPGGTLSDRIGRKPTIVAGWLLYAAVYLLFARAHAAWHAWALFAVYGLFFGLTEGSEKALVADLVAPVRRGTAFGWYNLAVGLGALPASLLFGAIWDRAGAPAAFVTGAALALLAAVLMSLVAPPRRG